MIRNYLKVALRNLWRNKTFSLINIIGLATGLGCFILIALYVLDELSYDHFYKNSDRIYRISSDIRFGGDETKYPFTSDMMGQALKKDYPQVEQYTRVYNSNGSKLVKKGTQFIMETRVAHADSTFFDVFSLPAIAGNIHAALYEPNTLVITETTARKYFGDGNNAIGKIIETDDNGKTLYKVTAVIKDIPSNSHFNFDFIFSMKNVDYRWGQYLSHNFHTYLLLKPGINPAAFKKIFDQYTDQYVLPEAKAYLQIASMDEFQQSGNKLKYSLTPLTDIHLYSNRPFELSPGGNIQYVYIFSAVAIFILLIACINFMNLTTARSANRAKEVGVRKVLGTERKNLITQFLSESTLTAFISCILAILLAFAIIPLFNSISGKTMSVLHIFTPAIIPVLLLLPFVVGLLAGSYPAFFLSSFKPIEVLKGRLRSGRSNGSLRSALVIFQFATSIVLIAGTIIIYRQLHYIQTKNLGYNKNEVLLIENGYALQNKLEAFKQDMLQQPGVSTGTISSYLPIPSSRSDNIFSGERVIDAKNGFSMQEWNVDYDYLQTLGIELIKGRNFSRDFGTDSNAVILNEATAKTLGYADPIGQHIYKSGMGPGSVESYTIIGVVKNFHFESLKRDIGMLGLFLGRSTGFASFKMNAANAPQIIQYAEKKWKTYAPEMPFSYQFLDAAFNNVYRSEQRVAKIAIAFSVLAILIACLGLFGLATYMAEQRTKEIGIRKVLGASVGNVVTMLSKDFLKLVTIAFCIAAPLAWWAMHNWLQDFAYRINISWWIFGIAGVLALFIALFTISFQAIKAAVANPVAALRSE